MQWNFENAKIGHIFARRATSNNGMIEWRSSQSSTPLIGRESTWKLCSDRSDGISKVGTIEF